MGPNIKISGLYDARQLVFAGFPTTFSHVISVVDPHADLTEIREAHDAGNIIHLALRFHDSDLRDLGNPNLKLATKEQIREILNFTKDLTPDNNLLIHCHAGVSRSTAVALGVMCQHGATPQEAINRLFQMRYQAFPNILIATLMDTELGLNGSLIRATTDFRDNHPFALNLKG